MIFRVKGADANLLRGPEMVTMKPMRRFFYLVVFCLSLPLGGVAAAWAQSGLQPQHVAVLYNENSAYSRTCAEEYARLRGVPAENCAGLPCSPEKEEIARDEYERTIARPVAELAARRGWHLPTLRTGAREIGVLLLMPDIPLKIAESPRAPGKGWEWTDAASVDSELACLGLRDVPVERAAPNPYFQREETIVLSGLRMTPVCRIQAPGREAVGRMIFDPSLVEKSGGLWGRMVIDEGGPYRQGDEWLREVARRARRCGFPVLHDAVRPTLAPQYPLGSDIAFYFGWYSHHADGPFGVKGNFRFVRGAVAVHLHSYSAVTLRQAGRNWCGPLLERGAACTVGNVYEPFLNLCTRVDILFDRLSKGYSWAEAAWMATPALSWQTVVLGDPLYRPFAGRLAAQPPVTEQNRYYQTWKALEMAWGLRPAEMETKVEYAARVSGKSLFDEFYACRAKEDGQWEKALEYLSRARLRTFSPEAILRLRLIEAEILMRTGKKAEGAALTDDLRKKYAATPWAEAARAWHARFAPPPAPPAGSPAAGKDKRERK